MRTLPRSVSWFLVPLALWLGCSGGGQPGPDDGTGDPGQADPVAGTYRLTSTYDLSQAGVLPDLAGDTLSALTGLADDPAGTLIALLQAADVPVVNELLDAIPDPVLGEFEGWVNDYIASQLYQNVPLSQTIADWVSELSNLLTHFDLVTELDLANLDAAGNTDGSHILSAVSFPYNGTMITVDTPALVDQITMARDVAVGAALQGAGGTVDIGDHSFRMPLGDFAVAGFNQVLQQTLGASNIRDALGMVIDCGGLADQVASKCVGPVCVGHRDLIEQFCNAGLDQVAAQVESRIAAIKFASLHLQTGEATLVDAAKEDGPTDGIIDRMVDGTWQVGLNVNDHEVQIGASSFAGVRMGTGAGGDGTGPTD